MTISSKVPELQIVIKSHVVQSSKLNGKCKWFLTMVIIHYFASIS